MRCGMSKRNTVCFFGMAMTSQLQHYSVLQSSYILTLEFILLRYDLEGKFGISNHNPGQPNHAHTPAPYHSDLRPMVVRSCKLAASTLGRYESLLVLCYAENFAHIP